MEQPGLLQSFNPGSNMQLLFHGTDESKVVNNSIEGYKKWRGSQSYTIIQVSKAGLELRRSFVGDDGIDYEKIIFNMSLFYRNN